jgi:hypothetical protein
VASSKRSTPMSCSLRHHAAHSESGAHAERPQKHACILTAVPAQYWLAGRDVGQ